MTPHDQLAQVRKAAADMQLVTKERDEALERLAKIAPSMPLDRAKEIVAACIEHVWFCEELTTDPPPSLAAYSLRDLLDANHLLAAIPHERDEAKGTTTVMLHCDDRLVAALYTLYHYEPSDPENKRCQVIAATPTAGVVVVRLMNSAERAG